MTQGSSFLATLGFETESRWDSGRAKTCGRAHAAVRAQFDLPDFFENLARDHFRKTCFASGVPTNRQCQGS